MNELKKVYQLTCHYQGKDKLVGVFREKEVADTFIRCIQDMMNTPGRSPFTFTGKTIALIGRDEVVAVVAELFDVSDSATIKALKVIFSPNKPNWQEGI